MKQTPKKKLFIVCTFPINKENNQFITHIPIRINKFLEQNIQVFFLYSGFVNENLLISNKIIPVKLFDIKIDNKKFIFKQIYQHFFILRLFFALMSTIREEKPDIIMNMNLHLYNIIFGLLGRFFNISSVARVTGNLFYNQDSSLKGYIFYRYRKLLELISLFSMDKIVCISHYLTNQLPQTSSIQQKIKVISPGIDTSQFISKEPLKKDIDMIFVGRMEPVKNIDYSFKIFSMLKKKELISNFHLIGNGSELSRLIKKYKDNQNVYFHKDASHNDIVDYLKRSKLLILTSYSEGFGNVVLEAMLCKTLVVVTPVSDMHDIIGNDERGILINYNDIEKNLIKITNILQNDKKRKTITESAFQYVVKNHSIDVLKKQYQSILLKDK